MKRIVLPLMMLFGAALLNAQDCDPQNWENSDDDKCKQALSVFHSDAKQKNYEGAYPHWRYYFCNCPKEDGAQKWVYIDGAKIILAKMKANKKDKPVLEAYYDTLMMVYDNWAINYGDEGKIASYKGLYTYAYQNYQLEKLIDSKNYFETSIDLLGNKSHYSTISYYMTVLQKLTKYKKADTAYWVDKYFVTSDIIDANLADSNSKYFAKWSKTREDIDNMMAPVLTCEQLLPIYKDKMDNEPSIDDLKKMVLFMEKKECTDAPEYERAANALCDVEPSSICKIALSRLLYKQGRYSEAKTYAEEAIGLEEDGMKKSTYYLLLADIQVKLGSTNSALSSCNSAISLNSNNGKAYMIKGSLYATLAKNCKEFEAKAAYWVVVDQYIKAKSVDPSVATTCNSRIASYSKYFPSSGEIFFETLKIGDPFTVKCLGVSTTIRAKVE
ncbi:MAG: tetratricopeptide repeat protein [Bacteroidia bacterium]